MAESHVLPNGWSWTTLGDICEPVPNVDPTKNPKKIFRYVDISSISNETFEITNPKEHIGAEAPSRARKPIRTGDILVSTVRTYLRNIAQVPPELDSEICSTGLCVLRLIRGVADPLFVFRYVLTKEFSNRLTRQQRGINYPAVTDRYVYAQPIPLPPFAEQERITARIEELSPKIREAKRSLQTVPKLARNFHQSILAKAFRGELTERDPNDEPAQKLLERIRQERRRKWESELRASGRIPRKYGYKEPPRLDPESLAELPEGWAWSRVDAAAEVRLGRQRSPRNRSDKFPRKYLRAANVLEDGFDLSDLKDMDFKPNEFETFSLKSGDVLLSEGSGTVEQSNRTLGTCAVWDGRIPDCCFQNTLIRVRSDYVPSRYFLHVFTYARYRGDFARIAKGIGIAHLGGERLASYLIPIAPRNEMDAIVQKIDALQLMARTAEKAIEASYLNTCQLEESILARAFRGELVPQDLNDEPASVLLERIRAQRVTVTKRGKHRLEEFAGPATSTPKT